MPKPNPPKTNPPESKAGQSKPAGDGTVTDATLLLVEPRIGDARHLKQLFADSGVAITHVETFDTACGALRAGRYDAILVASEIARPNGKNPLDQLPRAGAPVIALIDPGQDALGRTVVAGGAADYLARDFVDGDAFRKRILEHLAGPTAEDLHRAVVNGSPVPQLVLGAQGTVLLANAAAEALFHAGHDELRGRDQGLFPAGAIRPQKTVTIRLSRLDETEVDVELTASPLLWRGGDATLLTLRPAGDSAETSSLRKLAARLSNNNARLERLASCDSLTELPNRRGLEAAVASAVAQGSRTGNPPLAALIDCDNFKQINTDVGHAGGDEVLRAVAARLRESLRPADHVGRLGGDEFLAILPDTSMPVGMAVAQRLRMAVGNRPIEVGQHRITMTVSVGVVPFPGGSRELMDVVAATRIALMHSKAAGKDQVATDSGTKAISRAINQVVRAIADGDGIRTLAQPLFGLQTRRVEGYELLTRGPNGDFETPDAFFRLALQERILPQADLRCLDSCIEACASVPAGRRVHLNLFPTTVAQVPTSELLARLQPLLDERPVCLEISQQHVIGDPGPLRERLGELREAGVLLALDNVGSGQTSLETLIHLSPDMVKVDRHLISGVGRSRGKARTLERLLRVLELFGTDVAAVGIESTEDLEALRQLGVPLGQGFALGVS